MMQLKLPSLNSQILIGALLGIISGALFSHAPSTAPLLAPSLYVAGLIVTLFIDLLKMILIPLVFCSIAVGIANLRQHSQMQRVWVSTLVFFVSSMAIAIVLGACREQLF